MQYILDIYSDLSVEIELLRRNNPYIPDMSMIITSFVLVLVVFLYSIYSAVFGSPKKKKGEATLHRKKNILKPLKSIKRAVDIPSPVNLTSMDDTPSPIPQAAIVPKSISVGDVTETETESETSVSISINLSTSVTEDEESSCDVNGNTPDKKQSQEWDYEENPLFRQKDNESPLKPINPNTFRSKTSQKPVKILPSSPTPRLPVLQRKDQENIAF